MKRGLAEEGASSECRRPSPMGPEMVELAYQKTSEFIH